ncbi:MAG: integrase [Gammaproteobacteria bacterium]
MNVEIYDAFIAAGADEEKARATAQSVAHYDGRLSDLRLDLYKAMFVQGLAIVVFNVTITGLLLRYMSVSPL